MTVKAIVLGYSYTQFATWIRNRGYNRNDYGWYGGRDYGKIAGWDKDMYIYFLEGWSDNPNYTADDMKYIRLRFHNFKQISERTIMNEGFSF